MYQATGVLRSGALGGTRTHGLRLRKPALYPTELRARESGLTALELAYGAEGGI